MKCLRTMILFDQGGVSETPDWLALHSSYVRSIEGVKNPLGSDLFLLRRRIAIPRTGREQQKFSRNGVSPIRKRFFEHLTKHENWKNELSLDFGKSVDDLRVPLKLFPSGEEYREPLSTSFGGFDFATIGNGGLRAVIEWETGNISSSHRSMNKLCICLNAGIIEAGVLIVPSRSMYIHLTDRIGNIDELSGYLSLWQSSKIRVERGLLAITVVEHDELTDDPNVGLLDRGNDGRAEEGRLKLRLLK